MPCLFPHHPVSPCTSPSPPTAHQTVTQRYMILSSDSFSRSDTAEGYHHQQEGREVVAATQHASLLQDTHVQGYYCDTDLCNHAYAGSSALRVAVVLALWFPLLVVLGTAPRV